jgi:hypothetical protein
MTTLMDFVQRCDENHGADKTVEGDAFFYG